MKTSEIPLPPIPLPISAPAPPHGESLIALNVIRKRYAGQGESETGCQPVSPAPGAFPPAPLPRPHLFWHGSVLHVTVAHLISVLSAGKGMGGKGMKTSCASCLASFLRGRNGRFRSRNGRFRGRNGRFRGRNGRFRGRSGVLVGCFYPPPCGGGALRCRHRPSWLNQPFDAFSSAQGRWG